MKRYIFTLGQANDLAKQELVSFLELHKQSKAVLGDDFVIADSQIPAAELIKNLGGTIKIAEFLEQRQSLNQIDAEQFLAWLSLDAQTNKINFGLSLYHGQKKDLKFLQSLALKAKKILKQEYKQSARLVVGQSADLSSVIVAKNKLLNRELMFIIYKNEIIIGKTLAVQDFEDYAFRDMQRPGRDSRSGMLPPKVAQMLLNLGGPNRELTLLDPFCGSGTIVQEAALLNFKKILASDISPKAVNDTRTNLDWLANNYQIDIDYQVQQSNVTDLNPQEKIDLIVTEPFMGDARILQGQNNFQYLKNISKELPELYINAFRQFKKITSPKAIVIFIFPIFAFGQNKISTLAQAEIEHLGWQSIKPNFHSPNFSQNKNIIYQRPEQKVLREISCWQKK